MSNEDIEKELSGDNSNRITNPLQFGLNLFKFTGIDALTSMIRDYVTPKDKEASYQYAVCLHKEPADEDGTVRAWVRIPQVHSMIPLPRSTKDFEMFYMHAEFTATGDVADGIVPGKVLRVTPKNPGVLVGHQTGKIEEVMDMNSSFVAGGVGRGTETFENCFFGGQPPSFVLPPAGEKTSGNDSSTTATPEYKNRKISDSSGVECGKVYKFSDFEAKSLADLKTSKAGINLIHEAEAFRGTPYEDANERRLWTVGWGSKIDRRDADGAERFAIYKRLAMSNGATAEQADAYTAKITKKQADELFNVDLVKFEEKVRSLFKGTNLRQTQFDALVSISYNAGTIYTTLRNSIRRNPDDPGIAAAFTSHAVTAGGEQLPGLVKRRQRELDHYFGKISSSQLRKLSTQKEDKKEPANTVGVTQSA